MTGVTQFFCNINPPLYNLHPSLLPKHIFGALKDTVQLETMVVDSINYREHIKGSFAADDLPSEDHPVRRKSCVFHSSS